MPADTLIALFIFASVAAMTPGPNNVMLLASGTNFGLRPTLPHIGGVALGFLTIVLLVALGMGQVFRIVPQSGGVLKICASCYMLYLAWKIATSQPPDADHRPQSRPLTVIQAALFQWVNPKAWAACLTATAVYLPENPSAGAVVLILLIFAVTTVLSTFSWTILGTQLRRILHRPQWLRLFNCSAALLLIASLYPILNHNF